MNGWFAMFCHAFRHFCVGKGDKRNTARSHISFNILRDIQRIAPFILTPAIIFKSRWPCRCSDLAYRPRFIRSRRTMFSKFVCFAYAFSRSARSAVITLPLAGIFNNSCRFGTCVRRRFHVTPKFAVSPAARQRYIERRITGNTTRLCSYSSLDAPQ